MKTGEVFTIERIVMSGTGYRYAVVRLTGGVALVNCEIIPMESGKPGAPEVQRFTFLCLRAGEVKIQLARLRSFELDSVIYENVLPFEVEGTAAKNLAVPGGWSPFKELGADDKKIFDQAQEGLVGVKFTPEKVSKQIVNGTNYRFFCYGEPALEGDHSFPALVKIHAPVNGKATIQEVDPAVL